MLAIAATICWLGVPDALAVSRPGNQLPASAMSK
jgi:hypothetical protein